MTGVSFAAQAKPNKAQIQHQNQDIAKARERLATQKKAGGWHRLPGATERRARHRARLELRRVIKICECGVRFRLTLR